MKYEKIGIIAAIDKEIDGLVANMKNVRTETYSGRKYYIGNIGNKTVVAAKSGIGKVFAATCAQTMILKYEPDCIINIGIAGGLDERLKILDIVVATKVVQHDMNLISGGASGRGYLQFDDGDVLFMDCDETLCKKITDAATSLGINNISGTVASGDIFVADINVKNKIKNEFGASACEMEGGAIGQTCFMAKTPFCVLRAISDGGEDAAEMEYSMFAAAAADRSIKVIMKFLENDN